MTPWRRFIQWHNSHMLQIRLVNLLILIALLIFVSMGCGGQERPLPPAPESAGATLSSVGETLVWWGGISAAIGVALSLIALVYAPLAGLGAVFRFAAIGGLGVTATGSSLQWLSDNPIVCVLTVLASVGGVVWWYWPRIHRALDRRLDQKP